MLYFCSHVIIYLQILVEAGHHQLPECLSDQKLVPFLKTQIRSLLFSKPCFRAFMQVIPLNKVTTMNFLFHLFYRLTRLFSCSNYSPLTLLLLVLTFSSHSNFPHIPWNGLAPIEGTYNFALLQVVLPCVNTRAPRSRRGLNAIEAVR